MAEIISTTTDERGHKIVTYASGAIRDETEGKLIHGPTDPALNPILADPKGMLQRRRELADAAAWEAANATAIELVQSGQIDYITLEQLGSAPAVKALVSKVMRIALLAKSGREMEGVLSFLERVLIGTRNKIEVENNHNHTYEVSQLTELLHEARLFVESYRNGEIEEGVINATD